MAKSHELEYLIFLSTELNYLNKEDSEKILSGIDEIKKMLGSLIKKVSSTL